jgi:poly-gamma-glutamate synthesis protein (capsule biosynthesis protein)
MKQPDACHSNYQGRAMRWWWLVAIAVALLAGNATASGQQDERFPYTWTPESGLPAWQKHRVEESGPISLATPVRASRYFRKLFRKKFSAPPEVADWFDAQKNVLRLVSAPGPEDDPALRIALAGDIMWIRDGWSAFLDPSLLTYLNEHDLVFADLETAIARSRRVPRFWTVRKTFNSPPELLTSFRREDGSSTFSALSVGGNHALDYGDDGLLETIGFLEEQGIPHTGATASEEQPRWVLIEKDGFRVGFYAATYGINGAAEQKTALRFNLLPGIAAYHGDGPPDLAEVRRVLSEMRASRVDIKLVSLRWGYEFEYFPEPLQMQLAREMVAAGADVIMGHHSHAQQPLEVCFVDGYEETLGMPPAMSDEQRLCRVETPEGRPRKALVIYSLGNFVTTMAGFLNKLGSVQSLTFSRSETGRVDWHDLGHQLVYNAPKDPQTGQRRTLLLEDWLARDCLRKRGCREADLHNLAFVRGLLDY